MHLRIAVHKSVCFRPHACSSLPTRPFVPAPTLSCKHQLIRAKTPIHKVEIGGPPWWFTLRDRSRHASRLLASRCATARVALHVRSHRPARPFASPSATARITLRDRSVSSCATHKPSFSLVISIWFVLIRRSTSLRPICLICRRVTFRARRL